MEIADIFVVNKADREGADRLVSAVEANLALQTYGAGEWRPPVLKTVATTGAGVAELVAAIEQFRAHAERRRRRRGARRAANTACASWSSHRFMEHLERERAGAGELERDGRSHRRARARSVHRGGRLCRARSVTEQSPDTPIIRVDDPITRYPITNS